MAVAGARLGYVLARRGPAGVAQRAQVAQRVVDRRWGGGVCGLRVGVDQAADADGPGGDPVDMRGAQALQQDAELVESDVALGVAQQQDDAQAVERLARVARAAAQ